MQVVIFFALVAACCAAAIEKPVELINPELIAAEKMNGSQCIYRPELKTMSCRGSLGFIECPAVSNFSSLDTQKFQVFGIAKIVLDDEKLAAVEKSSALRHFWLYPRCINSTSYLNRSIFVEDKWEDLELYYSDKFTAYGIRITDEKCYAKLVALFDQTKFEHVAKIGSGLDNDLEDKEELSKKLINANETTTTTSNDEIRLFGETLLVEQSAQKRGFGRGFGVIGRGFGFGFGRGFGWGLGGWGMGMGFMNPWMNPWLMGAPLLPPPMLGVPFLGK